EAADKALVAGAEQLAHVFREAVEDRAQHVFAGLAFTGTAAQHTERLLTKARRAARDRIAEWVEEFMPGGFEQVLPDTVDDVVELFAALYGPVEYLAETVAQAARERVGVS